MSDVAVTWAKAQDCPTAKAKQVLGCLATYADAEGDVWALVPVLAMESQSTDRTVQRALKGLKAAGLISLTGRNHVHRGKRVPIWRLHLDQGFASSRARLQAEARARTGAGHSAATRSASCATLPTLRTTCTAPRDIQKGFPCGKTGTRVNLIFKFKYLPIGCSQNPSFCRACAIPKLRHASMAERKVRHGPDNLIPNIGHVRATCRGKASVRPKGGHALIGSFRQRFIGEDTQAPACGACVGFIQMEPINRILRRARV
jgi:hypothetical protein